MAFLTIAGTDYDVLTAGAQKTYDWQGESFRAYSGRYRSTKRGEKRNWNFKIGPMTQTMFSTLKTLTGSGPITISGTAFNGGTPTCFVEINSVTFEDGDFGGNDFYLVADIGIFEQ